MDLLATYAQAQEAITTYLHSACGVMLYVVLLIILRLASLFVKAWGEPYNYKAYLGNGGRSLSKCRNSGAVSRPAPRLLILKQ